MAFHFGTAGWRAISSEDFTFNKVRRVAQAITEYFIEAGGVGAQTVVGVCDTLLERSLRSGSGARAGR